MYKNIGKKIKGLAIGMFVVMAVGAIGAGIGMMTVSSYYKTIGLCVMLGGPVAAWVSSWLLYAFGELVENSSIVAKGIQLLNKEPIESPSDDNAAKSAQASSARQAVTAAGACWSCGKHVEQLIRCEIKDEYGVRYRSVCEDCAAKF